MGVGGGWGGDPLAWAATCAQDAAIGLSLLKLVLFGGAVLNPTEFLMTVTSACMLCVHFAAAWTCWRISSIAGCLSTLPMSARVDSRYGCTIFHGTWFCRPLSTACSWLHASLRYVACSLMCSGPLVTRGHLGAITANRRVLDAFSAVIAYPDTGNLKIGRDLTRFQKCVLSFVWCFSKD